MLDFSRRGLHWEAVLPTERVVEAGCWFAERGFALDTITGLDWLAEGQMEVVYDFFHPVHFWRAAVRTRVPRAQPELPTLSQVFPGAAWHERETHDFFGIRFVGHPNLTPLLLPEDAQFHPLRKDFAP
jgi:NADH-quinone oxidoreductase subunit C